MLTEAAIEMINLSEHFPNAICAHGRGKNMLIISKLDEPFQRLDRKRVSYQIEYRWLSIDVTETEAWACVKGNEFSYWSLRELRETGFDVDNPINLFDHFNLF